MMFLKAIIMGLVEGATEFLPVSSTGHLLLLREIIGFQGPPGFVFEVVIQLGAICAVCWTYRKKLFHVLLNLSQDPTAQRFSLSVVIAFLPAMIIGALAHDFIKTVLFESLPLVCSMLVLGGLAILLIEHFKRTPRIGNVDNITWPYALGIGLAQVLAMVPGVSRSGATIMGGMLLGLERKTAAEFSFFLAIPTMLGAAVFDLYKNRHDLTFHGISLILCGFIVAFLAGLAAIRLLLIFVQRRGYAPFAWYRMALGLSMLIFIYLTN